MLRVTCAIIEMNEKVLVVQRSATMDLPLKWEFPGGKIEKGEREEECIVREIREELNLEIDILKKLPSILFDYSEKTIELIPFVVKRVNGKVNLNEHADFKLLAKDELLNLDWAEADIPIVKNYMNL